MNKSVKVLILKAIEDALHLSESKTLDFQDRERLELKAQNADYELVTRKYTNRYKQQHNLRHAYKKLKEFVVNGGLE